MNTITFGQLKVGESLSCVRESFNVHDPYAVVVTRSSMTVGHVPRNSHLSVHSSYAKEALYHAKYLVTGITLQTFHKVVSKYLVY